MSGPSDVPFEMPHDLPLDDVLAPFAEEVRFALSGAPPAPSPALAAVLEAGFSHPTDKGDLLATAGSNVHGPARQAAGLPKWKKEKKMPVTGPLASVLAKLSGLGTAAKAAMAAATAATTMGLAGGAAGVLPAPAQTLVATAVNAVTPFTFPTGDPVSAVVGTVVPGDTALPPVPSALPLAPAPSASVGVEATSGSTSGSASAKTSAAGTAPTVPGVGVPAVPQVSVPPAVTSLVNGLPACVKNLIPAGGTAPNPTTLAAQIPSCIPQVLGAANLPPQVATCVSSVLGVIGGASGMSAGSVPSISALNLSACVPMDATKCVSSMMSLAGTLPSGTGGLPGVGSLPGLNSLPGLSTLAGCAPMDVTKCLTSMTGGVSTGAVSAGSVPKLDLSACMPTGLPTTSLPSFGNLTGFAGALPFFGR